MSKGRPREFDTDTVLGLALGVFMRKGYEGTSLHDLTAAMGIRPPSLYSAFGNKEGLFRMALNRYVARRDDLLRCACAEPTVRDVARKLLHAMADMMTAPDSTAPGCLLVHGALSCSQSADPIRDELAAKRAQGETILRERLEKAQAEGDLPGDVVPARLACFILTMAHGMAVQACGGTKAECLHDLADMALLALPNLGTK